MISPNKIGLVFAAILGGGHLLWSLLVLSGFAQTVYDFILWAHMIHLPITIGPFDLTAAVTLVIFTGVVGYILGNICARVWRGINR